MKKQLLKESEIRKMMKFANIGALSDTFISKINENDMVESDIDEDLELEEAMAALDEDDVTTDTGDGTGDPPPPGTPTTEEIREVRRYLREALEDELGAGDMGGGEEDAPAGEEEMDLGGEEEEGEGSDDALCSAMTALKALKMGLEKLDPEAAAKIEIETEEEEEGEEMDLGGEPGEDEMPELGGEEEEGGMPPLQESRIVSEVSRRVARRLSLLSRRSRRSRRPQRSRRR